MRQAAVTKFDEHDRSVTRIHDIRQVAGTKCNEHYNIKQAAGTECDEHERIVTKMYDNQASSSNEM